MWVLRLRCFNVQPQSCSNRSQEWSQRKPAKDQFQPSFYNSLGKTVGVVVHNAVINDKGVRTNLQVHLEEDAETLVLYPRLSKWRLFSDISCNRKCLLGKL